MRDHSFPAGLIFSPMKGVCSNELLSVQGCRDWGSHAQVNIPAYDMSTGNASLLQQASLQDVLRNNPSTKKKAKIQRNKRTRKRRTGGN